jgi:dipeptidyl aminopeptidase/acylaminoacyl peptidase
MFVEVTIMGSKNNKIIIGLAITMLCLLSFLYPALQKAKDVKMSSLNEPVGTPPSWSHIVDVKYSPKGNVLAFAAYSNGKWQLYLLDLENRQLRKCVELGKAARYEWTNNGEGLLYLIVKDEQTPWGNWYLFDLTSGNSTPIAKNAVKLKQSPTGASFCYIPGEHLGGLIYSDAKNKRILKKFFKDWSVLDFEWSPNGRFLLALLFVNINMVKVKGEDFGVIKYGLVDLKKGQERIIDSTIREAPVITPKFINSEEVVYFKSERIHTDKLRPPQFLNKPPFIILPPPGNIGVKRIWKLVKYDIVTGKKKIFPLQSTPIDLEPAPQGEVVAIVYRSEDHKDYTHKAQILDISKNKVEVLKNFTVGSVGRLCWNPNGKELVYINREHLYLLPLNGEEQQLL